MRSQCLDMPSWNFFPGEPWLWMPTDMPHLHRWPIEKEIRQMLSGSTFRWHARRQVNSWDIYDGWVKEFNTAFLKHPEDLLAFNGQDATHYRIGRNATVRFAPNLYPVLANIELRLPWDADNTATTTSNETYRQLAGRHELKSIRMLCRDARNWHDEDEADEFDFQIPRRFLNHHCERARRHFANQIDPPHYPPAAPALLSTLTDPTRTDGIAAPAGGRAHGTRARGSDDPADDDDSSDGTRPRSKARPSPPSRFR